jgi:hypothetical protein
VQSFKWFLKPPSERKTTDKKGFILMFLLVAILIILKSRSSNEWSDIRTFLMYSLLILSPIAYIVYGLRDRK